jgi:hypothetical protein
MKRKININRQKVSAEEIGQRKNFDSVLKNTPNIAAKSLLKKPWFLSGVVAAAAIVVATVMVLNNKDNQAPEPIVKTEVQADADSLALEAFYKAEEAKPCIAPPVKGLNVPYVTYKVNAEKGGVLDFKTGSKLTIPKNAFADENGKPVKGEVELRYREFHDVADFFVSGIPMTYDSGGVKYQFESAGMMEMLAYKDGKQLNMTAGKTINVELASEYKGTEYNLYKLDTLKNNWSCLGKDKVVKQKDPESSDNVKPVAKVEDTPEYKAIEVKKEVLKEEKIAKIAALPKPGPEPKKPGKLSSDKFTFNLDLELAEFPEFAVYKDVKWEYGSENKMIMTNALWADLNKTLWEDATLKEGNKKGENYLLSLKKGSKRVDDMIVYPVFEGKNYETAMKNFQEKFSKYEVALEKRKTEEKKIEEKYNAEIAALIKDQQAREAAWKKQADRQLAAMTAEEKVMRVFTVSSFGVYNCDNPSAYPQGVLCNAMFKSESDDKLKCYSIYLADKKRNGLFTYYKNPVTRFSFDPKSINVLWTVEDGVLYYLKEDDFENIGSGRQTITLSKIEQHFTTVDEMKEFFNI